MTSATVSLRNNASHFMKRFGWDAETLKEHMDHDANSVSRQLPSARASMWGWLLAVGALALFSVIANCQDDDCALTQFDTQLAEKLHQHARGNPVAVTILATLTALGSAKFLTSFAITVALVLLWRGQLVLSRVWGVVFAGCLLNDALKHFFQRHRPQFQNPFVVEASWSFPSGHAMGSLIGYGLLAYLLWQTVPRPRLRLVVVISIALLVSAIGFSRLYLGAHYFSDVVGGYAAGIGWLSCSISGVEMLQRRGRLRLFKHPSPAAILQTPTNMESV